MVTLYRNIEILNGTLYEILVTKYKKLNKNKREKKRKFPPQESNRDRQCSKPEV